MKKIMDELDSKWCMAVGCINRIIGLTEFSHNKLTENDCTCVVTTRWLYLNRAVVWQGSTELSSYSYLKLTQEERTTHGHANGWFDYTDATWKFCNWSDVPDGFFDTKLLPANLMKPANKTWMQSQMLVAIFIIAKWRENSNVLFLDISKLNFNDRVTSLHWTVLIKGWDGFS